MTSLLVVNDRPPDLRRFHEAATVSVGANGLAISVWTPDGGVRSSTR